MRLEYKLVKFVKDSGGGWSAIAKGRNSHTLGSVFYDLVRKEYVFDSDSVKVNSQQLVSISQFMDQLSLM